MSNTSATGGYLTPTGESIRQEDFEDALQAMVVGITGLPGDLVRPRHQPKPPNSPGPDTDWCAIGIKDTLGGATAVTHQGRDEGRTVVTSTDSLEVLVTFHGPGARGLAAMLRDGLRLGQNRAESRKAGITVGGIGEPRNAPELINGAWAARVDLPLNIQWETRRTYGVRNLVGLAGSLVTDTGRTRNIK